MSQDPPNWHFDYMAPIYDFMSFERDYEPILEGLALNPGDRLLDLAGGTGEFIQELTKRKIITSDNGYILDLSKGMIEKARSRGLRNVVLGDTTALPFLEDRFNGAFAGDAIHHMADPVAVFEEVRKTLTRDGRLVIEEFDPSRIGGKLLYWMELLMGMGSQFMKPETLRSYVQKAGFSQVEIRQDGFVYYLTAHH